MAGHRLWRLRTDAMLRQAMDDAFTRRVDIPAPIVADTHAMTYHAFTATSRATDDYLARRTIPDRLNRLETPTLVIFGEKDRRWKPSSVEDYPKAPDTTVQTLPTVGHTPMMEAPDDTAQPLRDFATR